MRDVNRSHRGIALITTLLISVVAIMFVLAALSLGPGGLKAGQSSFLHSQAEMAAESGISYALSQLRNDPTWRGDRNTTTINTADFYVTEDNGNVVGILQTPDGNWAQFRLRFNYQDGAGGPDGLDQPGMLIDHPYVSINNLLTGAPTLVPRADGGGFSVTPNSETPFEAPLWSVSLAVEGRAGPICSILNPGNLNPPLPGATRRVVEGIYQIPDMGPSVQESGSMAGGDFLASFPDQNGTLTVTSNSSSTPRLRSKGSVEVNYGDPVAGNANYVSPYGEVRSGDNQLTANYSTAPDGVTVSQEAPVDPFFEMAWDDVRKADPAGPKIPSGTYVWWDDGTGASLHYYDMGYDDYVNFITANPNDPGIVVDPTSGFFPPEVALDLDNKTLSILGDTYVEPTSSTDELNVIARLGAEEAPPGDPEANGGGGSVETYLAANPNDFFITQPGAGLTGSVAIELAGTSNDVAHVVWSNGQIVSAVFDQDVNHGMTLETTIAVMLDPGAHPGYHIDVSGSPPSSGVWLSTPPDAAALASMYGVGGSNPGMPNNGTIPIGVADTLSAADLKFEFNPPDGEAATLTCEGSVHLTSALEGEDGSITSGGDIKITGLGAQFAANEQSGVNMYAIGDIVFSTLDQPTPGNYSYRDVNLKGIIYTQGDFICRLGSPALSSGWGTLNLEGCLIAYGGDPSGPPGANGKGNMVVRSQETNIAFDPVYFGALSTQLPANFTMAPLSWTNAP